MFVAGDLAFYFGLSSEFQTIKSKNPNLNFDVSMIPQVKELNNSVTYGKVYALAIPKSSPTANQALATASALANGENTKIFVDPSGYSSVRRDLLSTPLNTKYAAVFAKSALVSRSWVDPDYEKTNEIFSQMVENVISGLSLSSDAVAKAETEFKILLAK
jgi:ABC-type glycerol-3-phosphate transport system substrate-binding protein